MNTITMNVYIKILIVFILSSSFNHLPSFKDSDTRPNIILIMVDDLGKEWISGYGAEDISTPNIDALASSGIRFDNVYAMPQCTPTRVTLLTGQYPFRHGWVNHWDVPRWGGGAHFDETMNPSIGIEMKKAGYQTAIAGKWQIDDFRVEPDALLRNGFDDYCMWTGYETGIPASANRYQDPYLFTNEGARSYPGQFGPDIFTEFVTKFIKESMKKPFFLYYPMVLAHTPFVNIPGDSADTNLGKHKAMVRYIDQITGTIIRTLEEHEVRDETLVIWTTDNGSTRRIAGNYQGRLVHGGKSQTSEPGICVPFLVSWPERIDSHRVSDALIDFTDLFPTLLDLAGVDIGDTLTTQDVKYPIDGRSFRNVLEAGVNHSDRSWILSMGGGNNARLTENGVENQFNYRDRVLRNTRYKLYINAQKRPDQFYDLRIDPEEQHNLLDRLTSSEQKENFQALWKIAQTLPGKDQDPRYFPNPAQNWDVEITAKSQSWKQ